MASRLHLHEELCTLLDSRNVYYNPPESVKLQYRCIKYSLSGVDIKRANDKIYNTKNRYELILIDQDPDTAYHDKILNHFQMCSFDRSYKADNLNHFVYTIYY